MTTSSPSSTSRSTTSAPIPPIPRRISDAELDSLTRSIRQFGFVDPVIARLDDKSVIGGHQRLLAARRLGLASVPVILLDLPADQARLLNLALNKISGSWDEELLARLLSELDASPEVDLSLSGFDDDEVAKLLKSLDARDKRERIEHFDPDAALNAAQANPVAQPGDLSGPSATTGCYAAIRPTCAPWGASLATRKPSLDGDRSALPRRLLGRQPSSQ